MHISKVIPAKLVPARVKALPIIAVWALGTSALCSAQTKNVSINPVEHVLQNNKSNAQKSKTKTLDFDAALRTFQFMDGSNMSCASAGISKSWDNLFGYFTFLGGYNFANKLPLVGTMGFFDYTYPKQSNKANLSAELYHESSLDKNGYYQKCAVTPAKLNIPLNNKVNFNLDPRMAFHIFSGQVTPKFEVLATISAQLYENLSAYLIGQIYDVTKPSIPGNYGINAGIIKQFKIDLPRHKCPCERY